MVIVLGVGLLYAGSSLAASADDSRTAKITELIQLQGLAQTVEQSKSAERAAASQTVRSMTDQMFAQLPDLPAAKRAAIEAASQQFLSDIDNSFDKQSAAVNDAVAHYTAVLRQIVVPEQGASANLASLAKPEAVPARALGSNPSVPEGKVIPDSVSDRCQVPPPAAPGAHPASPSGRSELCVCVDEKGKLTGDPVITASSGDPRVDSGAIKLARAVSGRYGPPTLDGTPQKGCFRFSINFRHAE
jgi:hypothetical protein